MVSQRLDGLDLARYLAFVGMVIVNFKIAMGVEDGSGVLMTISTLLEGRAAATFVVLAGIGLGLAAQRGAHDQTTRVTLKRATFLLVIGLLNSVIFDADILHYYAFYFLFGVLFLSATNSWLVVAIIAINAAFVAMVFVLDYDAGWNWDDYTYSGFWTPVGFVRNLFFNGWHPVIPWLSFLLTGLFLSRLALGNRRTQIWLIITGITIFALAEVSAFHLTRFFRWVPELSELAGLSTTEPIPPMPLYILAGTGIALAVIGICLLVSDVLDRIGILGVVIPAGRQTLTLYIAHILIGMGTLEVLGMLGGQSIASAFFASLAFCALATVYALLWSRKFKRGPIEELMRKVAG